MKIDDLESDVNFKKANKERAIIPFIGAGFSLPILPTWKDFSNQLLRSFGNVSIDDPLEAIEYYIWKSAPINGSPSTRYREGQNSFVKFVHEIAHFEKDENGFKNKNNNHCNHNDLNKQQLLCKKFNYIYTTNWDNLIEVVSDYKAIYQRSQFKDFSKFKNKKNSIIVKFHGDTSTNKVKYGDGLIASKTDYWKRMSVENPFDILFKSDLLKNKFVFIGYSFKDLNISLMIYQVMNLIKQFKGITIYWAITDYQDDPRVFCLQQHLSNMVPVSLLSNEDEEELKKIENDIECACVSCVKDKTIIDIIKEISLKEYCSKHCVKVNKLKKDLEDKRTTFISQGTIKLLNRFEDKE